MTDWLTDGLIDSLTGPTELTGWVACCMADWLTVLLTDCLTDSLTHRLINWPAGWLAYHSIHRFFYISISPMLWTFLHNTLRCPHTVDIPQTCRNTLPGEKCTLSLTWLNELLTSEFPEIRLGVRLSCKYCRRWIADESLITWLASPYYALMAWQFLEFFLASVAFGSCRMVS